MAKMRVRFPMLVLLLGIVFILAVSIGIAYGEKDSIKNPPERPEEREEEREPKQQSPPHQHEEHEREQRREDHGREPSRGRTESEESQEEEREQWREHHREQEQEQQSRKEREQEQHPQPQRRHDEEWQSRRQRPQSGREEKEEREQEQGSSSGSHRESSYGRRQHHDRRAHREEKESEQGSRLESRRHRNPYYFNSNRFHISYKNRNGQIRELERFNQRTNRLENLQNYRIIEFQSKPNTLILPKYSDADYILVVLNGRATITIVNPDKRQSYNLEYGDTLRLPAGTTSYILNTDDNHNLRVVMLVKPINTPGEYYNFYPSTTKDQQSYFSGFSKNTLESTFNTRYEEIQKVLLGEKQSQQDEGVIVKVSKEQIQELRKHAQSSSGKGKPSESGPFNLRSNEPIYSNKFGNFYEITPDRNPQFQDLNISLTFTEINKGALLLPHYNSKAIFVVFVDEGEGNYELVGIRDQQQQKDEQEEEEQQGGEKVRSYCHRLSKRDVFLIPAGYPLSINASSNLRLLGFGINADENQRNFLAGFEDNVIRQLDREVKELTFPGSVEDVERLIKNQQQSHFANAQPQQQQQQQQQQREKEGRHGRRGPISSILNALY